MTILTAQQALRRELVDRVWPNGSAPSILRAKLASYLGIVRCDDLCRYQAVGTILTTVARARRSPVSAVPPDVAGEGGTTRWVIVTERRQSRWPGVCSVGQRDAVQVSAYRPTSTVLIVTRSRPGSADHSGSDAASVRAVLPSARRDATVRSAAGTDPAWRPRAPGTGAVERDSVALAPEPRCGTLLTRDRAGIRRPGTGF